MNENELMNRIKDIVFSIHTDTDKFYPPSDCLLEEWEESSIEEKAFRLIEELLLNSSLEESKQKEVEQDKSEKSLEIEIADVPRFYSRGDENIFFEALNSIPSLINAKYNEKGLVLYFKNPINNGEREFLRGLLSRYQVSIPIDIDI